MHNLTHRRRYSLDYEPINVVWNKVVFGRHWEVKISFKWMLLEIVWTSAIRVHKHEAFHAVDNKYVRNDFYAIRIGLFLYGTA